MKVGLQLFDVNSRGIENTLRIERKWADVYKVHVGFDHLPRIQPQVGIIAKHDTINLAAFNRRVLINFLFNCICLDIIYIYMTLCDVYKIIATCVEDVRSLSFPIFGPTTCSHTCLFTFAD